MDMVNERRLEVPNKRHLGKNTALFGITWRIVFSWFNRCDNILLIKPVYPNKVITRLQ